MLLPDGYSDDVITCMDIAGDVITCMDIAVMLLPVWI